MASRRGISVMDLVGWAPPGAQALLPADVAGFLERLAVLDHHTVTSAAAFAHFGTVQADSIALPRVTGSSKPVEAPDLTRGVYFRLLFPRRPRGPEENVEPAPSEFILDLVLDPVAFTLHMLVPARLAPASGTTPAFLERANEVRRPSDPPRKVRLFARGALRVAVDAGGTVNVSVVNFPEPFDPGLSDGPVLDAWFEPPHFFMGPVGFSVGDIILDLSTSVTPPEVTARGQGPEWQGILLEEVTVFPSGRLPKMGIINLGVNDLLLGLPVGLQGEAFVELGRDPAEALEPAGGPVRLFTDDPSGPGEAVTVAPHSMAEPIDQPGRLFTATLPGEGSFRLRAQLDAPPPDTIARWRLPGTGADAKRATGFTSPAFSAQPGDVLQLQLTRVDEVDGEAQAVTFGMRDLLFVAPADGGTPGHQINVEVPETGSVFENVASVSGSVEALEGLVFVAHPGDAAPGDPGLRWEGLGGNVIATGDRHTLEGLNAAVDLGITFLVLRDAGERTRRVIVHLVAEGPFVVGCQAGIFDREGEALPARHLKAEYDLGSFHRSGRIVRTSGGTTIADGGSLLVPEGVLAEVTLRREPGGSDPEDQDTGDGDGTTPDDPRTAERVQILVDFDLPERNGEPLASANARWGDRKVEEASVPGGQGGPVYRAIRAGQSDADGNFVPEFDDRLERLLGEWAKARLKDHGNAQPPARFLVIGRCDDIRDSNDEYNRELAERRADAVAAVLQAALEDQISFQPSTIVARGEQTQPDDSDDLEKLEPIRKALYEADRIILDEADRIILDEVETGQLDTARERLGELEAGMLEGETEVRPGFAGRLINEFYRVPAQQEREKRGFVPRPRYRRIDVIALLEREPDADATRPSTNENELGQDPDLRRRMIWVPGEDTSESTQPVLSEPSRPMLVQVAAAWDSPTVAGFGDLVPTKFEVAMTWVHRRVEVPGEPEPIDAESCDEDVTVPEFWKLVARLAYDHRTGETVLTVGLDSIGDPKGLACLPNATLASTLALAPALMPLLDDAGLDGGGARLAALIALLGLGVAAAKSGRLVVEGVQAEIRTRGLFLEGSRFRLGVDYATEVDWDLGLIKGTGVRIRYRNVGVLVELDPLTSPTSLKLEDVRFVFDEASVIDVQRPGDWRILNPTLGRLLRVTAARVGTGSAWIEVDMAPAVNLGVITITEATVRATLGPDGFSPALRGLEVRLDVPGTVRGTGKLSVDPTGALSSAIELEIIPAGVSAAASLRLVDGFFSLFVDTRFATPLPLAGTGLGVFGFNGHLVVNGARALPGGDVVQRELAWYALDPAQRYRPEDGSWAVGLGAVIGTLPDEGFAFNAKGMLAIGLPDLSVVFGVDGQFLEKPGPAAAKGEPPPGDSQETFRLLGLLAVDPSAVTVGIRGKYRYRRLLEVDVPLGAHFPISTPDPYFIRVGSDGFVGSPPGTGARPGSPIIVSVLPDTLDLEASAFLMIEERGLPSLGGDPALSFPGFAIGAGLRFELDWGNQFIGLEVLAEFLAGIGFNPLTVGGRVAIVGEVYFLLLSAGIEGQLAFRYIDDPAGERVSIFGRLCARVGVWKFKKTKCGDVDIGDDPVTPIPPSPLAGAELVSRLDRVVGAASSEEGTGPTVWPDAIPVLHFAHVVDVQLGPDSAFDPGPVEGPEWIGSEDVRFSYRLLEIEIAPVGRPPIAGPLPSRWTFPSHRGLFPSEDDAPAGDERRDLHLLSDHPFRWARNMIDGAASVAADPVGTLERVCEPTPEPTPVCVHGERARRLGPGLVRLSPAAPSPGPYSSFFVLLLRATFGGAELDRAALELADLGLQLVFGRVVPLTPPLPSGPGSSATSAMYEAPHIEDRGRFVVTLPMEGRFQGEVVEPELVLALCRPGPNQPDPGSRCDSFEDLRSDFGIQELDRNGFAYRAIHGAQTGFFFSASAGGQRALRYLDQGLQVDLPETAVEVVATIYVASRVGDDVQPIPRLRLHATSGTGQSAGTATDQRDLFDENRTVRVRDEAGIGIDRVVLSGGFGQAHVVRLCYLTRLDPQVEALLDEADQAGPAPSVRGRRTDSSEAEWIPTIVPGQPGLGRPVCTLVRYRPPSGGEWTRVRIGPYRRSRVGVVRACAVAAEARRARDEAEQARQDFIDDWNSGDEPSRFLLEADTEYEIRVTWEAAHWDPIVDGAPSGEDHPPPDVSFDTLETEQFFFRTAPAAAPLPADEPIDTEDERTFDPRQTRRYLAAMLPDHRSPPHFTLDPVRVIYSIGYLETLLARYGRELTVTVRRTDPAPGSQPASGVGSNGAPPSAVLLTADVRVPFPQELLFLADARVLVATEAEDSCLAPPAPEGSAHELSFDLERNAEYDLLITAPAQNGDDAFEVVVARTNFRTSRFASPRELLDALEFTEELPSAALPMEVLVDGPLSATPELGDQAFEDAMRALGLDPFPLAPEPRVALLLTFDGERIEVVGALLEALEPIHRGGRLAVEEATLALEGGVSVPLSTVRRNDAGTRILLAPPEPTELGTGTAVMELALRGTREGVVRGLRFAAAAGPLLASEVPQ